MVIYEVNLEIESSIAVEYLSWLPKHVQSMLKHSGFVKAETYKVESDSKDTVSVSVHYHVENHEKLEEYLKTHAPKMRKEAVDLFGSKFKANRRVLNSISRVDCTSEAN
jgi:ribosomal protein S8